MSDTPDAVAGQASADLMNPALPYGQAADLNQASDAGADAAEGNPSADELFVQQHQANTDAAAQLPVTQIAPPPVEPTSQGGDDTLSFLMDPEDDSTPPATQKVPPHAGTWLQALSEAAADPSAPVAFQNMMRLAMFHMSQK